MEEYLNPEALYSDQWLLAYEANLKGWLIPKDNNNYVEKHDNFSILKSNNVYFYRQKNSWGDDELPVMPSFMPYDSDQLYE